MSPIKDFSLTYFPLNKENRFSAGDTVNGIVTFTLTKETKIKCLYVTAIGSSNMAWRDQSGLQDHISPSHVNTQTGGYNVKDVLVAEKNGGTVLPSGNHSFKFKVKLPEGNFPQISDGFAGYISHMIVATLSRNWHMDCTDYKLLNYVSGAYLPNVKIAEIFSGGQVHLSATVDKWVCSPGETVHVTAKIINKCSKKMKIECALEQPSLFSMMGGSTIGSGNGYKTVGPTIEPGFEGKVSIPVTIPAIHNKEKKTVEFFLKVHLKTTWALDRSVVLGPLIIPSLAAMIQHGPDSQPKPQDNTTKTLFPD